MQETLDHGFSNCDPFVTYMVRFLPAICMEPLSFGSDKIPECASGDLSRDDCNYLRAVTQAHVELWMLTENNNTKVLH